MCPVPLQVIVRLVPVRTHTGTLPSHEGWEGSSQQRVATKRMTVCVKKLEAVKPKVLQAFKIGRRAQLAAGGGGGGS
jgi:hypothetical protein